MRPKRVILLPHLPITCGIEPGSCPCACMAALSCSTSSSRSRTSASPPSAHSDGGVLRDHIDFWRAEPTGKFYLYRALQDDLAEGPLAPTPMTTLDFGLTILRTAEATAVPMTFARAMGLTPEETTLYFAFRWSRLRDRELSAWANPERFIFPGYVCRQPEVTSGVAVPLETPTSAIARFVRDVTAELFAAFNGFAPGPGVVEDLTAQLLNRGL